MNQRESDLELALPKSVSRPKLALAGYLLWLVLIAAVVAVVLIWRWGGPSHAPSSTDPDLRPDKAGVMEKAP
ncbi:MAG TPA: hypothetical protein VIO94_14735 [Phenylobacterium sp.]